MAKLQRPKPLGRKVGFGSGRHYDGGGKVKTSTK